MSQNIITTKTNSDKSRVWAYFKQCDGDLNRVKCNLCSIELCNKGTTTILWNHVKFKHSIDKTMSNQDNKQHKLSQNNSSKSIMTHTQLGNDKDLRKNLDFIDHNDLSLTSMKPLPSTSLSTNLISRLNQLSSPVTRKLKFWNKKSFQVNQYDPSFKVIYLGNLGMQLWSKDESCLDKPLNTLWNNYLVNIKTEIVMRLTICNSGLKAITRQHGLTQYWSNRLVFCCSHKNYPRIFSWVYRHEGKKMRQELRCHAVFCPSPDKAAKMVLMLNQRLACALQEFRREKKSRGVSIMSNISSTQQNQLQPRTVPLRRQILAKGSANFRLPLERSKSAPKLTSILEEDYDPDEQSQGEFEFEESFGDDTDCDGENINREDKDIAQQIESNSSTTNDNEETSNYITFATGDRSNGREHESREHPIFEKSSSDGLKSVGSNQVNRLASSATQQYRLNENSKPSVVPNTKVPKTIFDYSSSTTISISDSQNKEFHRSSANRKLSSSLDKEEEKCVAINDQETKVEDKSSFIISEAKNNNISNKPADDIATQEILLSWSNLVIK